MPIESVNITLQLHVCLSLLSPCKILDTEIIIPGLPQPLEHPLHRVVINAGY